MSDLGLSQAPPICRVSKDHWQSPSEIRALVNTLGPIGLDTCTAPNNPMGARLYFSVDNPAPSPEQWPIIGSGEVAWQNHPYSKNKEWCQAFLAYVRRLHVEQPNAHAILLGPASLGTTWWKFMAEHCTVLAVWDKRIGFINPESGDGVEGNMYGSCFFYFGPYPDRFASIWQPRATILQGFFA